MHINIVVKDSVFYMLLNQNAKMLRGCLLFSIWQLCKALAEEFDTIRAEYWQYVSRTLATKYGKEAPSEIAS